MDWEVEEGKRWRWVGSWRRGEGGGGGGGLVGGGGGGLGEGGGERMEEEREADWEE